MDLSEKEVEVEFERVVKFVQTLPKDGPYKPGMGEKLKFYSLYKQATEGPCKTQRPGFFSLDIAEKAKWDAWSTLEDMDKLEAKRKYIEACRKMEAKMKELGHTEEATNNAIKVQ